MKKTLTPPLIYYLHTYTNNTNFLLNYESPPNAEDRKTKGHEGEMYYETSISF